MRVWLSEKIITSMFDFHVLSTATANVSNRDFQLCSQQFSLTKCLSRFHWRTFDRLLLGLLSGKRTRKWKCLFIPIHKTLTTDLVHNGFGTNNKAPPFALTLPVLGSKENGKQKRKRPTLAVQGDISSAYINECISNADFFKFSCCSAMEWPANHCTKGTLTVHTHCPFYTVLFVPHSNISHKRTKTKISKSSMTAHSVFGIYIQYIIFL